MRALEPGDSLNSMRRDAQQRVENEENLWLGMKKRALTSKAAVIVPFRLAGEGSRST